MADFKPDVAVATVDVGASHRRRSEQHDGSRTGAGGSSSSGPAGSSHKTNLLGRLASFFGRNRSSGSGSGSSSSRTSSSSKKHRGGGTPSRGNKAVVVLKAKSMNDLAFPAIESWQQDVADPSSADQHHADREQQSTVPVASSASNDSLFGLREAAAAASVEDIPDGGGWESLASGSRALSQSADILSPPEGGAGIASVSSSLPSSGADGQSLPVRLGTSSRQLHHTDGHQLKQRPVSAVISALSEDDGLPWSSVDSVSSTPPTSGVDYDSSRTRAAASPGTAVVGVIAAAMPASKRFMFASDSMLSSTHHNSDSGILSDRSTDTEEEFFRDPWRASQHAGSRRHLSSDSDSDVDAIDLDIITKTEALTNPGARHKQLLRPKKSKASVPVMPKVEEKNVLEIASCFGAEGSRRQPLTATASFDATASSTATATASSAAATAAAPTSVHRRLSATNSVPQSLLSREVADAVRSRQRSSSDAAEQRDASSRTTTDAASQVVATTAAVAAAPSTGSAGKVPAARAAGTSMLDISSSLPHDDRHSEVVEVAATVQNRQPQQAAPGGGCGSFLSREAATEGPLVYSDVLPSAAGRLPSASAALASTAASSAVPDAGAKDASVTSAAAAAVPASISDVQASDDLMTGAAALAKYKSMFKQKPAITSVATPTDTAAHSPGDRNLDESMCSINLSNTQGSTPQGRRPQSSATESRLATSHPTKETASVSVAAPMALSLSADAVVPVTVVSANPAYGLALPVQPAPSSATVVTIAPGVSPSEIPDAGNGLDKPSGILLPSGPVLKPVKPLPSLKLLPSASAATAKSAHVSDRPSLPITRASRASLVGSQVLPSAASAATPVAEKTQLALLSSSGPPAEGRAAVALPNLAHSAGDAAVVGELGGPASSSVPRADQLREPVGLRLEISSHKPQESSHVPKVAAAVPAERTTIGMTAHTPGPERPPAAPAAAVAVDRDSDASYKRKSVRELVSQSLPTPATVDAAAVRQGLSHGPSVRRQQQPPPPPLPHLSSTHQQPAVTSKERPGDRAEDASAVGVAMAASRQPAGEPAPAADVPGYPGASSSSNGRNGTTTGRKSSALLTAGESSAAHGDTAARGSMPVARSQPHQLSIGRLPSSRSHNADYGLLPAERRLVVATAAVVPSATGVDALPAAAAATVVAAPSATTSSHHRAASAAPAAGAPNAASAVSKLTHPAPAPNPWRGLAGSNSSWTQERLRGDPGATPTNGSMSPTVLPDVLLQEPRPVAVGSVATALAGAAELDSSPAAVSAEKAASVKDRMKLFQRL